MLTRHTRSFSESSGWSSASFLLSLAVVDLPVQLTVPRRVEHRVRAKEAALSGEKGTGYFCPFHDIRYKGKFRKAFSLAHSHQPPVRQRGQWLCRTRPRLVGAGKKELTQKAEEALALTALNPAYTLEPLGEHFKFNTNTLSPTFKRL